MKLINGSGDTFDKVDFRTVEMMKGLLYDLVCSYRWFFILVSGVIAAQ